MYYSMTNGDKSSAMPSKKPGENLIFSYVNAWKKKGARSPASFFFRIAKGGGNGNSYSSAIFTAVSSAISIIWVKLLWRSSALRLSSGR